MRKILIDKNDTAAAVAEKVLGSPEEEVVLVVPKNTLLRDSISNFHLLKREALSVHKKIYIESVDSEVLALAQAAKLPAIHPLFNKDDRQTRAFSDIIPATLYEEKKSRPTRKIEKKEEREVEEQAVRVPPIVTAEPMIIPKRRRLTRLQALLLLAGALFLIGLLLISTVLVRAEITINFKKVPWQYQNSFSALKTATGVRGDMFVLPAEVFSQQKNTTQLFPASGRAYVSEKAHGKMSIYNAYSSEPQALVATTRFVTPEGKVFRLDTQVLIPGAQIKDGKIIPASIEANITADKAGEAYNVGPVDRLTIPGFKGSPKHEGFYGVLREKISGGFVGEKATPTEKDITAAKARTSEILASSLESSFLNNRPSEFTILDGASESVVTRLVVQKSTDANGNFSILGEAKFRAAGFRESDLKQVLEEIAGKNYSGYRFENVAFEYSDPRINFDRGEIKFVVKVNGTLTPAFEAEAFRSAVTGKGVQEVRASIMGLVGLADAKISIWPIWVKKMPARASRVKMVVH